MPLSPEADRDRKRQKRRTDPTFRLREANATLRSRLKATIALQARIADAEFWPLMQGYKAAERGQRFESRQTSDWKHGWRLWQRRNGKAA